MAVQVFTATSVAWRLPVLIVSSALLARAFEYEEEEGAQERRLYKLRAGEEDEWREMWVWGYAFMIACWIFITPRITQKKFPWAIRDRQLLFLTVRRRFERFVGVNAKEPPLPKDAFQYRYRTTRPYLYTGIFRTALLRGHAFILGSGALALTMSWWLRSAYLVHFKMGYNFLVPETVRGNFAGGAQAYRVLVPVTSFTLTLYLVYYVSRLYRIMDLTWKVQGRIYDFAILMGTLLMPHAEDVRVQRALWQVHRHLNLAHVLAFEEVSECVKRASGDVNTLIYSGLLDESEKEEFSEFTSCRVTVVFVWLSDLANRLFDAQIVPQVFSVSVLEALTELSDVALLFQNEVARAPPHIVHYGMQFMADSMCLFTPAMLAHIFHLGDPSSPTYFWPWAGSMVVAFFFQGMISLTQALEMPFHNHRDGLDPDWALMTTERQTFGCLSGGEAGGPAPPEPLNLLQRTSATDFSPLVAQVMSSAAAKSAAVAASPAVARSGPPLESSMDAMGAMTAMGSLTQTMPMMDSWATTTPTNWNVGSSPVTAMTPRPSSVRAVKTTAGENVPEKLQRPVRKEKVPLEVMPSEAPWAPREFEATSYTNGDATDQSLVGGGQWGVLSQDLLQATRAALLVPREITLDDVSLERLETVTARPLSELAAALLHVEPGSTSADDPLMLTDSMGPMGPQGHSMVPMTPAPLPGGNGHADDLKMLTNKYHQQLRGNSDMRAQVAASQTGLNTQSRITSRDSSDGPMRAASSRRALGSAGVPGRGQGEIFHGTMSIPCSATEMTI